MKRKTILYLLCFLLLGGLMVSCKQKHTYDFSYSPTSPKAGEKVTFTNTSDAGENWVWNFGDGGKSTLKSPTHTYKTAGVYVVEMQADSTKSRVASHVVEVLDSIPTIYVSSDTVAQYTPVTFSSRYYNPSSTKAEFAWAMDEELFVLTSGDWTSDSITGYFTNFGLQTKVELTITVGGKTHQIERTIFLTDRVAPSLLMEDGLGAQWRQRIYDGIYEDARPFRGDETIIEYANDSIDMLNDVVYDIHDMPVLTDYEVHALQVDAVNRKLYLILDDGVYVANANGEALTQIIETEAITLLIHPEMNSIYWSDNEGVKGMPLVTNPLNTIGEQQREKIHAVNDVEGVTRMLISE